MLCNITHLLVAARVVLCAYGRGKVGLWRGEAAPQPHKKEWLRGTAPQDPRLCMCHAGTPGPYQSRSPRPSRGRGKRAVLKKDVDMALCTLKLHLDTDPHVVYSTYVCNLLQAVQA